jgi:hypothetical protein
MRRWRRWRYFAVLVAAVSFAVTIGVIPAYAASAPFTWGSPAGWSWCPSFHGYLGCDNTQSPAEFTTSFSPSQVSVTRGAVDLTMNSTLTTSGAFNSSDTPNPLEELNPPYTVSTEVFLPCTGGEVDNWPAVWLAEQGNGTQYSEVDVAEGDKGALDAVVWYGSPSSPSRVNAQYPDECGTSGGGQVTTFKVHTYTNARGYLETDVFVGSTFVVGAAQSCSSPCTSIGTALPADPLFADFDYAGGKNSGPAEGNTTMKVLNFSYSNS